MVQTPPRFCWPIYGSHNGSSHYWRTPGNLGLHGLVFPVPVSDYTSHNHRHEPQINCWWGESPPSPKCGSQSQPATWVTSPNALIDWTIKRMWSVQVTLYIKKKKLCQMIMRYCKTIKIFCFVRTNTSIKSKHKKSVILLENSLC